jgi:hypothetical protein
MIPDWLQLASVIASPAFAAGGAYMAVHVRLQWLRRDVDRAHERIDEHERTHHYARFSQ